MKYYRKTSGDYIAVGDSTPVSEALVEVTKAEYDSRPAPVPTQQEIKAQISALDIKRIRPLAEGDTVFLAKLNDQIKILRAQLK